MKKNQTISLFRYSGMDKLGQKVQNEIRAKSILLAKIELRKRGIDVHKIAKKNSSFINWNRKSIKTAEIALLSRQLATLIESGIPLIQSFDILAKGQSNPLMLRLIEQIKHDVQTGHTLSEALRSHPIYFNELFCNLIEAGEKSGSLGILLDKIATYKEQIETIKKKIKKAFTYPIAVLIIALSVTITLLLFVVPQFETLFKSFGAELPFLTLLVVNLPNFFQSCWHFCFGFLSAFLFLLFYGFKNSSRLTQYKDRLLLKSPILGLMIKKTLIARFSRTFSITFAAGLPLVESLQYAAGAAGNYVFIEVIEVLKEKVVSGQQINIAMKNHSIFPSMVQQMIAIGEESGTLEKMLHKIADFYEEDVNHALESLSSLLEPVLMIILGVLIGGLVIAMYLPIFQLGTML